MGFFTLKHTWFTPQLRRRYGVCFELHAAPAGWGFCSAHRAEGPVFYQIWWGCVNCGHHPHNWCFTKLKRQKHIIQCKPGLPIIHNKTGIQEAPIVIGGEYRNQWGLRTTVQPWFSPCAGLQVVFTSSFGLKNRVLTSKYSNFTILQHLYRHL